MPVTHGAHGGYRCPATRLFVRVLRSSPVDGIRALASVAMLLALAACSSLSSEGDRPGGRELLRSNLSVASTALAAGQPAVARRLYLSLAERFDEAPEPLLGLGYIALQTNDLDAANEHFLGAADLAKDAPATRAEALLGAGRTALAQGDTKAARQRLEAARKLVKDPSSVVWIENGLAVAAVLDGDYDRAETHYAEALRHSPEHPRITANYMRMLVVSERIDDAARIYDAHDASFWEGGEDRALRRLIDDARLQEPLLRGPDSRLLLHWPAVDPLPPSENGEERPAARIERAGLLGFALRLAGESGAAILPPAAAARSLSGSGDASSRQAAPESRSAATAQRRRVPESGGDAPAADEGQRMAAPRLSEASVRTAHPPTGWIVMLGKSRQWRLAVDAEAVAAASPDIADVQLLSPKVLYVIGRSVGHTSVSVLSKNGSVEKRDVSVLLDIEPLRALLAGDAELVGVSVQRLARGVALSGEVGAAVAAGRALRLAAASLPEGMAVENNLRVGLDLAPLQALMVRESGLHGVRVQRVARGVALTGAVDSAATADRALRLAAASLPEDMVVESNLRVVLDVETLRAVLATDTALDDVSVQGLARGVALTGEVRSAAAADRALRLAVASLPEDTLLENNLRIAGPQQVNLEVQIAEVQRSIAEDFGFNWQAFGNSADPLGFGFQIGRALPGGMVPEDMLGPGARPPIGRFPIDPLARIPPAIVDGQTAASFIFQRAWDNIGITGVVDALAQAGLANVLARPNVTANSGETASFFSGGEYPLPTGYDDGVVIFEYKKYGVLLDFIPTIVDDGRIELTVRPEVSEPSQDKSVQVVAGVNVPVMNVRRAETTVGMRDGESIVIAGLFRSATNEVESGVPLLKDLPLIGALFGHTSTRSDELELIVTVTARLVQAGPAPDETGPAAAIRVDNYYF